MDSVIQAAIENKELPALSFWLERHGRVAWRKAYGRARSPTARANDADTIFDLASLDQIVATHQHHDLVDKAGSAADPVIQFIRSESSGP